MAFKRIFMFAVCMPFVCTIQAAGGDINAGLSEIAQTIIGTQDQVKNVVYAIAAVVALIGAFSIFSKMMNGDQDVKKAIMLTVGGCLGLIAMASALPAMFK